MKKSNIFAFIELSKLVTALTNQNAAVQTSCKDQLMRNSSFFNFIESKYFSDDLRPEWDQILAIVSAMGPKRDEDGFMVMNRFNHTIHELADQDCEKLVDRLVLLQQRVKEQFE